MRHTYTCSKETETVIRCALAVHRVLGPGLLESAYQRCLAAEFRFQGIEASCQVPVPIIYRDEIIPICYRLDFVVEKKVVVELKAIDSVPQIAVAQVLTYLKLTGFPVALLINFNFVPLRSGIKRLVNNRFDMSF